MNVDIYEPFYDRGNIIVLNHCAISKHDVERSLEAPLRSPEMRSDFPVVDLRTLRYCSGLCKLEEVIDYKYFRNPEWKLHTLPRDCLSAKNSTAIPGNVPRTNRLYSFIFPA